MCTPIFTVVISGVPTEGSASQRKAAVFSLRLYIHEIPAKKSWQTNNAAHCRERIWKRNQRVQIKVWFACPVNLLVCRYFPAKPHLEVPAGRQGELPPAVVVVGRCSKNSKHKHSAIPGYKRRT